MPAKMNLKTVKDRLKDETLDLSHCELEEVPVREIAIIRKATYLDLSNNMLTSLPNTFATLKQIVKLDLSKNMLTEIPENIGEMRQLKHLDLYANQISRLPLSFCELKNLKWLDLKENPLTPAVASVAGPCSNLSECQNCARNVVTYLSNVKMTIGEETFRRINKAGAGDTDTDSTTKDGKKEGKKKKKKTSDKENKKIEKNESEAESKVAKEVETEDKLLPPMSSHDSNNKANTSKDDTCGRRLCNSFVGITLWLSFFLLLFVLSIATVSMIYKEESEIFVSFLTERSSSSLKTIKKQTMDLVEPLLRFTISWANNVYDSLNDAYWRYLETIDG